MQRLKQRGSSATKSWPNMLITKSPVMDAVQSTAKLGFECQQMSSRNDVLSTCGEENPLSASTCYRTMILPSSTGISRNIADWYNTTCWLRMSVGSTNCTGSCKSHCSKD